MTRTTPARRTTLHLTQILRTDERTFMRPLLCRGAASRPRTPLAPPGGPGRRSPRSPLDETDILSRLAADDPPPGGVVGHQLDDHGLPRQQPEQARSPRDVGGDRLPPLSFDLHAEQRVGERLDHPAGDLQRRTGALIRPHLRHAPPPRARTGTGPTGPRALPP